MTDSASDDEGITIDLKFKTIQETYELRIKENSNIEKVKRQLSKKINQPEDKICLIFSGKILKDHETLMQHKIGDGMVVHMVIKNANKPQQQSRESTPSSASSTTGPAPPTVAPSAGSTAGQNPLGGMGAIFNNPMVRDMLNPLMETFMNNPEMMRSMLEQNPQFQQIIQNNPEFGHILNDPRIMQQTLEMIRNPNMFNELMRNHDQAIRNLQGIPGGEAALHRLYQEVQEPLMNSVLGAPGTGTQYAANNNNGNAQQNNSQNANSRSQHAGVENAEALPNPWSRVVNQNQHQAGVDAANAGAAPGGFPFGDMMNSPGMQSMLRQILSNPNAMQSLMSPENMRQFSEMVGNPQLADQMRSSMSNPQMIQAMTNPRVLNAMMQLQQALRVLNEEMPGMFPNIPGMEMLQNMGGMARLLGGANSANQQQHGDGAGGEQNVEGNLAPIAADGGIGGGGAAPPQGLAELHGLIALMNLGNNQPGAVPTQPPEERYRTQLELLSSMGFTDQQANIQALLASYGDVNMAIERLLARGGSPSGTG